MLGCRATAAAGALGLGGIAVYTISSSASLVHYNSMLNDCTYAYEDCFDKPNQVD